MLYFLFLVTPINLEENETLLFIYVWMIPVRNQLSVIKKIKKTVKNAINGSLLYLS